MTRSLFWEEISKKNLMMILGLDDQSLRYVELRMGDFFVRTSRYILASFPPQHWNFSNTDSIWVLAIKMF